MQSAPRTGAIREAPRIFPGQSRAATRSYSREPDAIGPRRRSWRKAPSRGPTFRVLTRNYREPVSKSSGTVEKIFRICVGNRPAKEGKVCGRIEGMAAKDCRG